MQRIRAQSSTIGKQHGAALVVAMIFLLLLSFLGLAAMGRATQEERMARQYRKTQVAFEAAEAALRDAKQEIISGQSRRASLLNGASAFSAVCGQTGQDTLGLCLPASSMTPVWLQYMEDKGVLYGRYAYQDSSSQKSATPLPQQGSAASVFAQPRYLIEALTDSVAGDSLRFGENFSNPRYRITVRAYGPDENTQVWLQETVRR